MLRVAAVETATSNIVVVGIKRLGSKGPLINSRRMSDDRPIITIGCKLRCTDRSPTIQTFCNAIRDIRLIAVPAVYRVLIFVHE